ncbi:Rieske 2Fe-2S domain-containing protein [Nocardia brasiliensis]|uniref:Rieske 2Fe-2S domain-containing protein n=1 Tax=Nocardia brasiliensis TaxID=37326 RepID=UPI002458F14B|nr:Rieske 2Fe-2S domain-containing protein [Nocardia brasiliensis]
MKNHGLPYPNGWFAVAFTSELPPSKVLSRRIMGEDIVVYRTKSGQVRVAGAYCPHLGAHLGCGGFVRDENLFCPFHHFGFAIDGTCTSTPYGKAPPKAQLTVYPHQEVNGAIFVWRHADELDPTWKIPDLTDESYPEPIRRINHLSAYPQDICENLVDIGHFPTLHGYQEAELRSISFDNEILRTEIFGQRHFPIVGHSDFHFNNQAYGVGFQFSRAYIPLIHTDVEAFFMPTPTGPRDMDLRVSVSLRLPGGSKPHRRVVGSIIRKLSRILTQQLAPSMWQDLVDDFPIWNNKLYLDRPRIAAGDGPIPRYRRWAQQFYSVSEIADHNSGQYDAGHDGASYIT